MPYKSALQNITVNLECVAVRKRQDELEANTMIKWGWREEVSKAQGENQFIRYSNLFNPENQSGSTTKTSQ